MLLYDYTLRVPLLISVDAVCGTRTCNARDALPLAIVADIQPPSNATCWYILVLGHSVSREQAQAIKWPGWLTPIEKGRKYCLAPDFPLNVTAEAPRYPPLPTPFPAPKVLVLVSLL